MYTNRRVKVRDLMGIANFNLSKRGKLPVKSAITVLNRSRARNKRSIQGKKHIGENNVMCVYTCTINLPGSTQEQLWKAVEFEICIPGL